ncbi:NADH dehydrogenase subunit 6 (mitochondrion) [Umbelopsis nana]|jgi:NADH-ubiquinone oxidoreductase chain 6
MNTILLDLLAFGSVLSGILVITSRNPIISVLFLIAVFVNVSCYLILLGINFIGLTYLIIYVGAIAILFLFVVMMMNIKLVELTEVNNKGEYTSTLPLGAIVGSLFLYELAFQPVPTSVSGISSTVYNLFDEINLLSVNTSFKGTAFNSAGIEAYTSFNNLWDNAFTSFQQLESVGSSLYTVHMMFLIIASMILLLAMIGPIVLTHKPTKRLH